MKASYFSVVFGIAASLFFFRASAQLPYTQDFKRSTASGVIMSGSARLTAANAIDADGQGYLRLTDNIVNQVGYLYAKDAFPSYYGLTVMFEFYTYKADASANNQADGISFFLYDASVNAFRPGGVGGSLGYAQYWNTQGMSKGYIGIGIDEFGNYSYAFEKRNGGPGKTPGAVVVRGPGDGNKTTDYPYITGVQTGQAPHNISFSQFKQRYPDFTSTNYRRIKIILTPGSSLGTDKGYKVTVTMFKGGTPTGSEVTLIENFDYPYLAPANLRYGFAASTGSNTDFHEVRNLTIAPTNASALTNPTSQNDMVSICQVPKALLDVTANDASTNVGGIINKVTIDLDPVATGLQNAVTDPGKGNYTLDQNGLVTFTPVNGFTGTSQISYVVSDNYGKTTPAATITVNVLPPVGPSLTVTDPAGVCAPQVVDITNSSLRSNTTPGATYSYFNNLTDANNNTNNINSTAHALSASGLYFIRANVSGCYNVQPLTVQVSSKPTTASAGSTKYLCSPGSVSLDANDPLVGTGTWSQVSGPSTANFVSTEFSNSSVSNLERGTYSFRWTIASGACAASTSNVSVNVINQAAAGRSQDLAATATSATPQANEPLPGTGLWTQENNGAPAATIVSPSSTQTVVNGLSTGKTYRFRWTISQNSCTNNFSTTDVRLLSMTLPVRFLLFTGDAVKEGVQLRWQTESEKENSHFLVERSADGSVYTTIGRVAGNGTVNTGNRYDFLDKDAGQRGPVLYYRLQQVDRNGQVNYSTVVKILVTPDANMQVSVWPNPYKNSLQLTIVAASTADAMVRLYDPAGRLVTQQPRKLVKGQNNVHLTAPGKGKGLYILQVATEGENYQQKVIRE